MKSSSWLMRVLTFFRIHDYEPKYEQNETRISGKLEVGTTEDIANSINGFDMLNLDGELLTEDTVLMPVTIAFDGKFGIHTTTDLDKYQFAVKNVLPDHYKNLIPSGLYIRLREKNGI